jgi:hypothetical protein
MDWIERILGISPDHGSCLTETLLLVGVALVGATAFAAAKRFVAARQTK